MDATNVKTESESRPETTYVWRVPGKPIQVDLDLDMVARLEAEVMQGFGAVPRRGLEVGGILLGTIEQGAAPKVHITDFEPVLSRHEQGPSYILTGSDLERLEEAIGRWDSRTRHTQVVGYYRSHTREGLHLAPEDLRLFSEYFPEENAVALVVKPYATRPSVAGLFFREEGTIRTESSYQEFPFRRRELAPGSPEVAAASEPADAFGQRRNGGATGSFPDTTVTGPLEPDPLQEDGDNVEPPDSPPPRRSVRLRGGWVWIPLSFIFLLLGTVLGFQIALSVRSEIRPGPGQDPYALHLSATPTDDSVHVRWNRSAEVLRKAQRGLLVISEGGQHKSVELDMAQLRNGSVIYRRASGDVLFRLEVFTSPTVSVAETVQFQAAKP